MIIALYLLITTAVIILICELGKTKDSSKDLDIPVVRYSNFLPNFLNRLIFFITGPSLIHDGYNKYKDIPYRVLKADGDLIVLPQRYADELKHYPPSIVSSLDAQFENVLGEYTNVLIESKVPSMTVSKKLVPMISKLLPRIMNELDHAFDTEIPKCEETWASVDPYNMVLRLLTRSTSRIIAGPEITNNETWMETVTTYTLNVGKTIVLLRPLPDFLRPLVAKFLPSVKRLKKQMNDIKDLFTPMILARREAEKNNPEYEKPDDFLQWMIDLSDNDRDRDPGFMAQNLFIIMSLAVVHTSTMALTQTIFDLVVHSEYVLLLREEIKATLPNGWKNGTFKEFVSMRRLDSFLRESQRLNPSSEVNFHRIVKSNLILSDGFHIPAGTHICFPSGPFSRDDSIVVYADKFSGFRWSDGPTQKPLVTLGVDNMHFGFGRQACPGRVFAATMMKVLLSRLITEYKMKFEDGVVKRPANLVNGEQIFPNLWAKVLVKKIGSV